MSDIPNGSEFASNVQRLTESFEGIRRYSQTLAAHIREADRELARRYGLAAAPTYLLDMHNALKALAPNSEEYKHLARSLKSVDELLSGAVEIDYDAGTITTKHDDASLNKTIGHVIVRRNELKSQLRLLHEGALILAVAYVEVLVAALLRIDFKLHPTKLDKQGAFTLAELQRLGSIDDARQILIENNVDETMRSNMLNWIQTLKDAYNLKVTHLDKYSDSLKEIIARRNLIVHNGGIVNARYQNSIAGRAEGPRAGARISVSSDYLMVALDTLETTFVLLAAHCWEKCYPNEKNEIAEIVNVVAYSALKSSRWEVARTFSEFVSSDQKISYSDRLIAKINFWQACKWSGKFAEVREEIEGYDIDAFKDRFKLGWLALLDKKVEFFELLEKALRNTDLYPWEAHEWPIFREMRKQQRFKDILKETTNWEPSKNLDKGKIAEILATTKAVALTEEEIDASVESEARTEPSESGARPIRRARKMKEKK